MTVSDPAELKRKLRSEGFEIYRTIQSRVHLAERVRDNLIMDSGVAADLTEGDAGLSVEVIVRAQASHFPGAEEAQIQSEVETLAKAFAEAGYAEEESLKTPVPDPSDPALSLDTSHEIRLRRPVTDLDSLYAELRNALSLPRSTGED